MDTLVNIYPTLVVYCVVLSTVSAVIACVTAWWLFKPDGLDRSERDAEIAKKLASLKNSQQRMNRLDRRMSQKCQRLERRVKRLESIDNKGEKE